MRDDESCHNSLDFFRKIVLAKMGYVFVSFDRVKIRTLAIELSLNSDLHLLSQALVIDRVL
jgi:hypothetical protein